MPTFMTVENLAQVIVGYVADADGMVLPPLPKGDPIAVFLALKRKPIEGKHYGGHSVFEIANRTLSDLVVLSLGERLLTEGLRGHTPPVVSVRLLLGTENDGNDVSARLADGRELCAECFNVAPSFFRAKLQKSRKKLRAAPPDSLQVIAYNVDAAPSFAPKPSKIVHVPIDVDAFLMRHRQHKSAPQAT